MKSVFASTVIFIQTTILGSTVLHGQTISCDKIIFSDSLFNKSSDIYDFDILTGNIVHNIKKGNTTNINDIITIDNDCLKFRISYACGCGTNQKQLITNGILHQDSIGQNYYEIKFLFTNHNKGCKALCHDKLSFDITKFNNQQTSIYLKFVGFDQLIKCK